MPYCSQISSARDEEWEFPSNSISFECELNLTIKLAVPSDARWTFDELWKKTAWKSLSKERKPCCTSAALQCTTLDIRTSTLGQDDHAQWLIVQHQHSRFLTSRKRFIFAILERQWSCFNDNYSHHTVAWALWVNTKHTRKQTAVEGRNSPE